MGIAFRTGLLFSLVAVSACGGSGDDVDLGATTPEVELVPGDNGLPYGALGLELADAEGETIEVSRAEFVRSAVGESFVSVEDGTITLSADFFASDVDEWDATLTFLGEDVTIENGAGTLASGQTVRLFEADEGTYSAAISAATGAGDVEGTAYYVFGFETDPDVADARTGSAFYSGEFVAFGRLVDDTGALLEDGAEAEMNGALALTVNFDDDEVTGDLNGEYLSDGETIAVDLELDTNLIGNGFNGDLSCDSSASCSSATTIDGALYGPNAQEAGGVIAVDATNDVNGSDMRYVGSGGFVIEAGE